jgi:NitT/TauT family transport system substrate-binding protein
MTNSKTWTATLAFAALCFCSAAHAQDKLRVGLVAISESLAAVAADKLGYFKAENIEVELSRFNASALALPLVQAGKLDIALSNTVSTLQAIEQGFDLSILAPGAVARTQAPDSTFSMIALKGAIKSPKDLAGKRIAMNVIKSATWLYVVAYLDKHAVDRASVKFVEIGFPQMNDPLLNGQVDVITQVEPFATVLADTGKVDRLAFPLVETQPGAEITQYVALSEWVKKNPQLAQRFARAIAKGAEYLNNPANLESVREMNVQYTGLNPAIKDRVVLPRFGTRINVAELATTGDLMVKYGLLKKNIDIKDRILGRP